MFKIVICRSLNFFFMLKFLNFSIISIISSLFFIYVCRRLLVSLIFLFPIDIGLFYYYTI